MNAVDAASAILYRWDDMPAEPMKGGITRRFITVRGIMIAHEYFMKGDDIPQHSHVNEQITYIPEAHCIFGWAAPTPAK